MNTRCIAVALSAAGASVLATVFVSMAVASADDFYYDSTGPLTDSTTTQLFGGIAEQVTGNQMYDVVDLDQGGAVVAQFDANLQEDFLTAGGLNFTEFQVTQDLAPVNDDMNPADNLPVGSVFETLSFGNGYENEFLDIPGSAGGLATITDTLVTPFGDFNI